ncbi:MAG: guanylate kinase [Bacteroidales bacterium]|nr:guanylate kinase [Bacteroidales bacterium]
MSKVIIISAPSGSGKSTLISSLMQHEELKLSFSVSATTRSPRGEEINGKDYYFFSVEEFEKKISENAFIEYEQVYQGRYYGTLKSEIERIFSLGFNVIFDVDVKGGINLKKIFGDNALSIFIQPPSVEELKKRLIGRGTDSLEEIEKRVSKAEEEISYSKNFDKIIINDDLKEASKKFFDTVSNFLS